MPAVAPVPPLHLFFDADADGPGTGRPGGEEPVVARTAGVPRPIAYLMALYLVQGWVVGSEGFSGTHTTLILLAWALSLAWMIWLVVVAWRMPDSQAHRLTDAGAGRPAATSPTITHR